MVIKLNMFNNKIFIFLGRNSCSKQNVIIPIIATVDIKKHNDQAKQKLK